MQEGRAAEATRPPAAPAAAPRRVPR